MCKATEMQGLRLVADAVTLVQYDAVAVNAYHCHSHPSEEWELPHSFKA